MLLTAAVCRPTVGRRIRKSIQRDKTMKRTQFWTALAIAVATWTVGIGYADQAAAQESADAQAGAEADAQADTGAQTDSAAQSDTGAQADAAADTQSTADQSSADQSEDSSATATNESSVEQESAQSETQASATGEADAAGASAEASGSAQTDGAAQSEDGQRPLPAPSQDAAAQDRDAAAQDDSRAQPDQRQPADRADAPADARADADANAQGRRDGRDGRDGRDRRDRDGDRRGRRDRSDFRAHIHFGAVTRGGLTINTVRRDSIFFRAGLRQGDVLVSVDGRPIRSEADFHRYVVYEPGHRVPVIVIRDGRRETVYITYEDEMVDAPVYDDQPVAEAQAFLGVIFDAQNPDAAVVIAVSPGSPAEQAGLQRGDMIVALNNQPVNSHRDAIETIAAMQPGDRLAIDFSRRVDDQTQAILAGRPGARSANLPQREVRGYRDVPQDAPPANDVDIEIRRENDNRRVINREERQSGPRPLLPRLRN
jgi:PDZ domain